MPSLKIKDSPYIIGNDSTSKIMWTVIICLLPALAAGGILFGPFAVLVVGVCVLVALSSEMIYNLVFRQKISTGDGSAVLTGLLLGLMMPPHLPLYIPAFSSAFAILVIKMPFGGLGRNWINPAIAGRIAGSLIWAREMSHWQKPFYYLKDGLSKLDAVSSATVYAITGATPLELISNHQDKIIQAGIKGPLSALKHFEKNRNYLDLFLGNSTGSIGETSALALIIGAAYLFYKKIIRFDITLSFLLSFAFSAWLLGGIHFAKGLFAGDVLFHVLSGGLILGAFYMATDMVTHPMTQGGRIVFGVGCGLITMLFRIFTYFPEGVMFAIFIMNLATPLINKLFVVKPFGYMKEKN